MKMGWRKKLPAGGQLPTGHLAGDVEAHPTNTDMAGALRESKSDTVTPDPQALDLAPVSTLTSVGRGLGSRPACFKSTTQEFAFVGQATVAIATSSFLAGATLVMTALIGRDLAMTQGEISWIGASTSLTAGAFQLGLGQLADLLGRKTLFLCGMASFSAFALLVGFAQNPLWMDVVCGLMGISSAMVVPPAVGILGAAYNVPSKRKNLAFSAFSAGNPLGFVFGSILCGIATHLSSWRAAFWLLAVLWAIFTALAVWTVPDVEAYDQSLPPLERLKTFFNTFDSVGTVLTIFGTGMFAAALTWVSYRIFLI
jgi:MFS family permease